MRKDVIYAQGRHLRRKRHLWQIRHLSGNRAFSYRALAVAAIFIRPGSRTQVMNHAQGRHLSVRTSSMRKRPADPRVMYASRGHLWHGRHVWPLAEARMQRRDWATSPLRQTRFPANSIPSSTPFPIPDQHLGNSSRRPIGKRDKHSGMEAERRAWRVQMGPAQKVRCRRTSAAPLRPAREAGRNR